VPPYPPGSQKADRLNTPFGVPNNIATCSPCPCQETIASRTQVGPAALPLRTKMNTRSRSGWHEEPTLLSWNIDQYTEWEDDVSRTNRTLAVRLASALLSWLVLAVSVMPVASAADDAAIKLDPNQRSDVTGTVLITGSNRGIGLELARNYAARGWTVIASARKPAKADELNAIAEKYPLVTVEQLDLLDHAGIDALAKKYQNTPIDVLLNNAAILGEPDDQIFSDFDYDLMTQVFAVNVVGSMKMAEAFAGSVAQSKQKKIVAISSSQGSISGVRSQSLAFYNVSKAALNMGMRSNSKALKKRGITVAIISPGAVDTDMMNLALNRAGARFKLMTPQQSAEAVINIIDQYGLNLTGTFLSHSGSVIPW